MSLLEERPVLLMTATIEAREGLPGKVLADAVVRRQAYEENLAHWLRSSIRFRAIVLAENSDAMLGSLEAVVRSAESDTPVEILKLASTFPGEFGKGYGESLLIEAALDAAKALRGAVPVVKLTGLQRVANLQPLLARTPGDIRLMIDLREHSIYQRLRLQPSGMRGCDTRCMVFDSSYYRSRIAGLWRSHEQGEFYVEDAFYRVGKELGTEPGVQLRFPLEPDYRGLAGHWGKNYDSPTQRLKWLLRALVRRAAPKLWI